MNILTYMKTADLFAKQTHCTRAKVGTALVDRLTGRLLATGYNGTIKGTPNCDDYFYIDERGNGWIAEDLPKDIHIGSVYVFDKIKRNSKTWKRVTDIENCVGDSGLKWFWELHHKFSLFYEVHSEVNAIMSLSKSGNTIPFDNIDLYVTTLPCDQCLKTIACAGIKRVYYNKEYDRQDTKELIQRAKELGVTINQLTLED